MKTSFWMVRSALVAAAFGLATAVASSAPPPHSGGGIAGGKIKTVNATNNRVWVTIYDIGRTRHTDYGWMEAHGWRVWGSYLNSIDYHVRAEVAAPNDTRVHPKIIADTTITITVNCNKSGSRSGPHVLRLIHGGTGNYFWENLNCADAH